MTAQTPAQAIGLKPGSRIATTKDRDFGPARTPAGTRGTLIEDDGTDCPYFEMDVPTGLTFSGSRNGYAHYLSLSAIRPLTPEELAEEARAKEPAAPDPRDARIAELEKERDALRAEFNERLGETPEFPPNRVPLHDRIRGNCEAAPWVVAEIRRLEQELSVLRAQLAERRGGAPKWSAGESADGEFLIYRVDSPDIAIAAVFGLKDMRASPYIDEIMERLNAPPVGPDEVVVRREEWEALNEAVNHAREYIRSDRQEKREWKGWTLDEFDAACERLDTLREGGA